MGYLLLEGGAEFGGRMSEPDLRALELAGGPDAPLRIIPTAAAPDNNHAHAGMNGLRWFKNLGARNVESVPLIDKKSAGNDEVIEALQKAKLIYMLGGFTHFLGQTLKGSLAWAAVLDAYRAGAVIAGSSAGAMVMCDFYYDPGREEVHNGLELVPNTCVLPHHNTFGKSWASQLRALLPGVILVGIDERTGMVDDGTTRKWTVFGAGKVTLYRPNRVDSYPQSSVFSI